jgi:hypothetical protein
MARQSRDADAAVSRPNQSQMSMSFAGRKVAAALKSRRSSVTNFRMRVGGRTLKAAGTRKMKKPPGFPGGCGSFRRMSVVTQLVSAH